MASRHGASHVEVDAPTTRPTGGSGETDPRGRPQLTHSRHAGHVLDGETAVGHTLSRGRARTASSSTGPGRPSGPTASATSTITGRQLRDYRYDRNLRLRGPDGRFATDPTAPPGARNR